MQLLLVLPADTRPQLQCPAVSRAWISSTRNIFGLLHQPVLSLSSTPEVLQVFALQFGFKLQHEKVQNRSLKKSMYQSAGSLGRPGLPAAGNGAAAAGQALPVAGAELSTLTPLHTPTLPYPNTPAPRHPCTPHHSHCHRPVCFTEKRGFSLLLEDSLNKFEQENIPFTAGYHPALPNHCLTEEHTFNPH